MQRYYTEDNTVKLEVVNLIDATSADSDKFINKDKKVIGSYGSLSFEPTKVDGLVVMTESEILKATPRKGVEYITEDKALAMAEEVEKAYYTGLSGTKPVKTESKDV